MRVGNSRFYRTWNGSLTRHQAHLVALLIEVAAIPRHLAEQGEVNQEAIMPEALILDSGVEGPLTLGLLHFAARLVIKLRMPVKFDHLRQSYVPTRAKVI